MQFTFLVQGTLTNRCFIGHLSLLLCSTPLGVAGLSLSLQDALWSQAIHLTLITSLSSWPAFLLMSVWTFLWAWTDWKKISFGQKRDAVMDSGAL